MAWLALYRDRAIHRFNDGSASVEAQAEPAIVAVRHRALETSKDARLVFGGNADALVLTVSRAFSELACSRTRMGLPSPNLIAFSRRLVTVCSSRSPSNRLTSAGALTSSTLPALSACDPYLAATSRTTAPKSTDSRSIVSLPEVIRETSRSSATSVENLLSVSGPSRCSCSPDEQMAIRVVLLLPGRGTEGAARAESRAS